MMGIKIRVVASQNQLQLYLQNLRRNWHLPSLSPRNRNELQFGDHAYAKKPGAIFQASQRDPQSPEVGMVGIPRTTEDPGFFL